MNVIGAITLARRTQWHSSTWDWAGAYLAKNIFFLENFSATLHARDAFVCLYDVAILFQVHISALCISGILINAVEY